LLNRMDMKRKSPNADASINKEVQVLNKEPLCIINQSCVV